MSYFFILEDDEDIVENLKDLVVNYNLPSVKSNHCLYLFNASYFIKKFNL